MRAVSFLTVGIAGQRPRALVAPERLGIIIVGMRLIEVTEPLVKPVSVRDAGRSLVAQAPLADRRGVVTSRLEELGDCQVGWLQRHARVAANPRVAGMHTRNQTTTRWSTDGAAAFT